MNDIDFNIFSVLSIPNLVTDNYIQGCGKNFVSDKIICMLIMRILKIETNNLHCTQSVVYTIRTVRCVYTVLQVLHTKYIHHY